MDPAPRKLRIGISGSYGGMNLGDEADLPSSRPACGAGTRASIQIAGLKIE
jgi:hypothetical protein